MIRNYKFFWSRFSSGKRGHNQSDIGARQLEALYDLPNYDATYLKLHDKHIDWLELGKSYEFWTEFLIDYFIDNEYLISDSCFNGLSQNPHFEWTLARVYKYKDYIYWRGLTINKIFKPTVDFLKTYKENWDWDYWYYNESNRENFIIWTEKNIVGLEEIVLPRIKGYACADWSDSFIINNAAILFDKSSEGYHDFTSGKSIYSNKNIRWNKHVVSNVKSLINWDKALLNPHFYIDDELLSEFSDQFTDSNWSYLSSNLELNWSLQLIKKYENKFSFWSIISNEKIVIDFQFLNYFENKVDKHQLWSGLSRKKQKWNFDLIKKFKNKLDWGLVGKNSSVLWTVAEVKEYIDILDVWGLTLYGNINFEIIEFLNEKMETTTGVFKTVHRKFSDFGTELNSEVTNCWDNISMNANILWNDNNLDYYFEKINWYYFSMYGCYKLSNEYLNKIPKTAKKFDPQYSMHKDRDDYIDCEISELLKKGNLGT